MIEFNSYSFEVTPDGLIYINGELANGHYIDENDAQYWMQNGEYYSENNLPHYENKSEKLWWCGKRWHKSYEEYVLAKVMQ